MSTQLSLMSLFDVGAHRGNRKSKLNPKLKNRIYGFGNSICLINLVETISYIEKTSELMSKLGQKRRQILIVGTAKHIQPLVPEFAKAFAGTPMPYINNRWLGGTLTNWSTIKKTLKTLDKLKSIIGNSEFFNNLTKNEQLNTKRKYEKIARFFDGLVNLKNNRPGAILVLDNNPIAIKEADAMGVPVIALTNTGNLVLSDNLKNTIVCNNTSVNTVKLIVEKLIASYNDGINIASIQPIDEKTKDKVTVSV